VANGSEQRSTRLLLPLSRFLSSLESDCHDIDVASQSARLVGTANACPGGQVTCGYSR
jgi:hypothetical protein